MPLTRSKRKLMEETQRATKMKPVELVVPNKRRNIANSNNGENFRQDTLKIQSSQHFKLPLTQINSSQLSQSSSQVAATPDEVIVMLKKCRKVLDRNFKNVSERLELDAIPRCLYERSECMQFHNLKAKVEKASENDAYVARTYLTEERHYQFFHFVRHNIIGFNQFPGVEICIKILQELLKYKANGSSQLKANYVVSELLSLFSTIIHKFPPCQLRSDYLSLFLAPFHVEGYGAGAKSPVLPTIIDLIHDEIFTRDAKEGSSVTRSSSNSKIDDDFTKNFYKWDVVFHQESSLNSLQREDRIERLFMALSMLVSVLENDLAVFMVKYSHKYGLNGSSKMQRPLICSAIWQSHESVVVVNHLIKKITVIFVAMNEMKYPAGVIQIASRLLSLVGQVINMYEYSSNEIEYPTYKNFTMDLVREIQKNIESSSYCSMDLYIAIIENLRSPLLRMLLSHRVIEKICGREDLPVSLSTVVDAFANRYFERFDEFDSKSVIKSEKYPVHVVRKNVLKVKVSRDNYLRVLMLHAEAINGFYRIKACVLEIKNMRNEHKAMAEEKNQPPPTSPTVIRVGKFDKSSFKRALINIDLTEKITLRCVDTNFSNSIHIQFTRQTCFFYRNEIKNFWELCKQIWRTRDSLGAKSRQEWMKLLESLRV